MERSGVVVDTSIFIDYLRAKEKLSTVLYQMPDEEQIFINKIKLLSSGISLLQPLALSIIYLLKH